MQGREMQWIIGLQRPWQSSVLTTFVLCVQLSREVTGVTECKNVKWWDA